MKTYVSIQYLRALAALAVAAYHAHQWLGPPFEFEVGRAGVDVFFVISGFIMWTITAGQPAAPGAFLLRRATRVAPSYWAITIVMAALAVAWPSLVPQIRATVSHVALSMAFVPHYDPLGLPFPMLPAGWTLNYEAAFYLIFAAALSLPERRRALAVTVFLLAIGCAGYFDARAYELGANFMFAEFAIGLWIGRVAQADALPGPGLGAALAGAGAVAFAVTNTHAVSDGFLRPLWWGLAAGAVVMGALALEKAGRTPRLELAKILGDASYAIYLVHTAAIALVVKAIGVAGSPMLFLAASLAATIAVGLAWRAGVEKPLIAVARAASRRSIARI